MKRHAWLTLGLCLTAAVGCGDEDSKENSEEVDSGLPPGNTGEDWSDEITGLTDSLNGVTGRLDELDGRLDNLENPEPGSCSEGELCIPDGVDLASAGFGPIVQALCTREVNCCDAGELNYLYGAAIRTSEDCVATFNDLVNNGYAPEFFGYEEVARVVEIAHALNDTDVLVGINATGVQACADYIAGIACPVIPEEPTEPQEPNYHCTPYVAEDYPCDLSKLLTGMEREGDTCNPDSDVPECGGELVCRPAADDDWCNDESGGCISQGGICSVKASVGDRCTEDWECDDLFCNHATGLCQARAQLGEPCEYVDPTFDYVGPFTGGYGNGTSTKIDCAQNLSCDPVSETCVADCSLGYFCTYNSQCPTNSVCNHFAYEGLHDYGNGYTSYGVCTAAVADGGQCEPHYYTTDPDTLTYENECASKRCLDHDDDGTMTCQPALKAPGTACTTANTADATCNGGWCGAGATCAQSCPSVGYEEGCPAGQYCATYVDALGINICGAKLANTQACNGYHEACTSGYCTYNTSVCAAKAAANGGACDSGYDQQCPAGQFCNSANQCAAYPSENGDCTAERECAEGFECWDTTGQGTTFRCLEADGGLPDGTWCNYDGPYDGYCASGWCRPNSPTAPNSWVCSARLAQGVACDLEDQSNDECAVGLFCAYGEDTLAGTCQPQSYVGQPCNPRYDGDDCFGGDCEFRREAFICGEYSVPEDELFCHYYGQVETPR